MVLGKSDPMQFQEDPKKAWVGQMAPFEENNVGITRNIAMRTIPEFI